MKEIMFVVEDAPEGGYSARALGYSIYTQADTWDELQTAIEDAVVCHFGEADLPDFIRLDIASDDMETLLGK